MTRSLPLSLLLGILVLLTGCSLPLANAPVAWIDAPLSDSSLPLAPNEIVFHAYAAGNPQAVELTINGQAVSPDSVETGQSLVLAQYTWSPDQPGRYVIAARAQDNQGTWSEPDVHVVVIGESTITPTAVITITPTPTSTPTSTPTASPPAAEVFSNLVLSTNLFYRMDAEPTRVTFTIQVNDPAGIRSVDFYFRLRDPSTGETTAWSNLGMSTGGGGSYSCTLANSNPALAPVTLQTMILDYQFIVTHPDQSLTRSQVYSDVNLKRTY